MQKQQLTLILINISIYANGNTHLLTEINTLLLILPT